VRGRAHDDVQERCVTPACDLRCGWCVRSTAPDATPSAARPQSLLRLVGGDPYGRADLAAWRSAHPRLPVEVEGPGHALEDPSAVARLAALRPLAARVCLPGLRRDDLAAWTGMADLATRTFAGVEVARAAGIPVHVVVPVNAATVGRLDETVSGVVERLRGAPVILQRRPLPADHEGWGELDGLGAALLQLRRTLPAWARPWIDELRGWPPCALPAAALGPELIAVGGARRPPNEPCARCAWRPACAWRTEDREPLERMRPLGMSEARALLAAAPRPRAPAAPAAIPDLPCYAPWTSLVSFDGISAGVPCAKAWVDGDGEGHGRVARPGDGGSARRGDAGAAREGLPRGGIAAAGLAAEWNGPVFTDLRAALRAGERSPRCRDSCRVILGVERRGLPLLDVDADTLAPEVEANRRLVLAELAEGRSTLRATPLELGINASSRCNFSCGFCAGPEGRFGELSEARFAQTVAWLPAMMQLVVPGPGEPLMSPSFLRLLEHVAQRGYPSLSISLTTNGTLLTREWLRRHESVRWGHVRVSVNAGSAGTHERMTGRKLFAQLLDNLEALSELRRRRPQGFALTLSCVLSRLVEGDLLGYAELVHRLDAAPALEPMTGDAGGLSPFTSEAHTRRLADECAAVARAFETRDARVHAAFDAMARFARERLARGDLAALPTC
jgi:hypothetical protein